MMISVMNLKISWKRVAKWVFWGIVLILFLVFFIRVAVFEENYYNEKEGSERAVAVEVETEELDEVVPTEEEIVEYTVAADRPRYLTISALGISKARVLAVGVTEDGAMDTPNNIWDVGWYEASSKPGEGGTMVIDGHNGGPNIYGVFKELPSLAVGEIITVERGDGTIFNYRVVENVTIALEEANKYMNTAMTTPENGKESLTLISCTGEWSQAQGTYLSRQFVRAVLVN